MSGHNHRHGRHGNAGRHPSHHAHDQHDKHTSHRYQEGYTLNPLWDLDGLTQQQQESIDPGMRAYFWTPIPIGMMVASYLAELLSFVTLRPVGEVTTEYRILNGTAGAGGSTIALGKCFSNVVAGDFCQEQLKALRHNVIEVMKLGDTVTVDKEPANVTLRNDTELYHAMLLEPCWGGLHYKEAPLNTLELYLQITEYNGALYDNLSGMEGHEYEFMRLATVVANILRENKTMRCLAVLLPYNANLESFTVELQKAKMQVVFMDPHKVHPPNLNSWDFSGHRGSLTTGYMDDLQKRKAYPHYRGPDVFAMVLRYDEWQEALKANSEKMSRESAEKTWDLLWRCTLHKFWPSTEEKKPSQTLQTLKPQANLQTGVPVQVNGSTMMCMTCLLPIVSTRSMHLLTSGTGAWNG